MPSPPSLRDSLLSRIRSHDAIVGIIGMGYVGLPLALAFVEKGFPILAFDVDPEKVAKLNRGEGYIKHLDGGRIADAAATGRFKATGDFTRLGEAEAILICVPTPLTPQRDPDMSYVISSAWQVKATLRPGQLVILESTTYPGTTDELLRDILEGRERRADTHCHPGSATDTSCHPEETRRRRADEGSPQAETSSLRCGTDFFLAFSPEREDPGNKNYGTTNTPKVVGGVDEVSGDLAQALYDQVITRTVRVSSARTAEAAKLTENIFRAVNIALVNELKVVYDRMGIDIWEVLDAAETKPFGFMRFNPGPGWGGHCIPLDPFYLSWKAREVGVPTKFIELAGEVNVNMPRYVLEKLQRALNDRGKAVRGSKVLILGVAYKRDIDDSRESPAFEIIELLEGLGATVSYHDPNIPILPRTRRHPDKAGTASVQLSAETLGAHDAVVIVTNHTAVDYGLVVRHAPLVVDTRGVFREQAGVVKA